MISFFRFCGCFLLSSFSSSDSSIDMCINSLYVNLDLVYCANCGKVIRETDLSCKSFLKRYISGNLDSS